MTRYLCISVMFLDSFFHGQGDEGPEWPPSPMRLYQSIVAGARTGCRNVSWTEEKANAFRWLAGLPPPEIFAPAAQQASSYTLFVPNNDSDKVVARKDLLTSKVVRPHCILEGDTAYYLWPIHDLSPGDHVSPEIICREARHLSALGWGIDMAVGNGQILDKERVAALPGRHWKPWSGIRSGSPGWRVPVADSLEDLELVHSSFLQRIQNRHYQPPVHLTRFAKVHYLSCTELPVRSYAFFELSEGVGFRQEDVARVAAMLRSLTIRSARNDIHDFPGGTETYVAGHMGQWRTTPPRFSYFPIPTIGHEHADGIIRRVIVAEPFGGDGVHAKWVQTRLRTATLVDERGNERGLLLDTWRPSSNAMIRRYTEEARMWSTVTPVVLPGRDDGKHSKAEKLMFTALEQSGVPISAVAGLILRKAPFWKGSGHARDYFVPAYLKDFPMWHVHLEFREPIHGPLSFGSGRHVGLGLFAAVKILEVPV